VQGSYPPAAEGVWRGTACSSLAGKAVALSACRPKALQATPLHMDRPKRGASARVGKESLRRYRDSLAERLRIFHFVQQRNRIIFSRDLAFAIRMDQELVFTPTIFSGSLPGRGTNIGAIQLGVSQKL
jgi:hypothetical protein